MVSDGSHCFAVKSPIIMKVDSPVEDRKEQEENESNNEVAGGAPQVCSPNRRSFIAASRFGVNPFALRPNNVSTNSPSSKMSKSVLRPSQLGQMKPFALNPSKLNAFAKPSNNKEEMDEDDVAAVTTTTTTDDDAVAAADTTEESSSNGDAPKFMPLIVSTEKSAGDSSLIGPPPSTTGSASSHSFVFGQNLQERVVADGAGEEPKPSTSVPTNGTSDMLFSSAAVKESPTVSTPSKTLSESAREYEEQRANKRKYDEVEVVTGEENETNILHLCCKLFAFDKAVGNWQERGRGTLRLNDQQIKDADDRSYTQSRVLFRTTGVLRLILNTKIWAEMTVEQASAKSIRFTAMDASGEIKVFLVMANPEEIKQLYRHLKERLSNEQKLQDLKRVNRKVDNKDEGDVEEEEEEEQQEEDDDDAQKKVKKLKDSGEEVAKGDGDKSK